MRIYELIVLLHPDLEIDADAPVAKIEKIITDAGGKVIKRDNWGKKRLAYRINKHDFGVYVYFKVQLQPESVRQVEDSLRITEEIIRHLLVSFVETKSPAKENEPKKTAAAVSEED
ncbi:MAG TPA: 30S ribosomal protein S6 [Candidatus Saccharimonadales bacterium]|nr:30S ribosomal protein S6 [Candidatus Saccharimonadales bacterium]